MKKEKKMALIALLSGVLIPFGSLAHSGQTTRVPGPLPPALGENILWTKASKASVVKIVAVNSLGMHCYDSDFSVFSILPLFNVINAQVIKVGAQPQLLDNTKVSVSYRAQKDPDGSINKTSAGKTNFWNYVEPLFGAAIPADTGLLGQKMPGTSNTAQLFLSYDPAMKWFSAAGIPITAEDDAGNKNPYPLMSVRVSQKGRSSVLYSLPTVVPASDEMNCGSCHLTGEVAASDTKITWSTDTDPAVQYKQNILLLHDARNQTTLYANQPVLCAECHYSPALDLNNEGPSPTQQDHLYMSHSTHGFHASKIPQNSTSNATCYNCHPGTQTQCLRGVMAAAGITCISCHGSMVAVGNQSRAPWTDEPKCQSCHTGDALNHLGGSIRLQVAYADSQNVATPRTATNKRFAENDGILYRNSLGHNGVACPSCHGSPHTEWPSLEQNDNLAAIQLQGHSGKIIECKACHGSKLSRTINGPHGLHNVNDPLWYDDGHSNFFEQSPKNCQACHGKDLNGTVLSQAADNRSFKVEDRIISVTKGQTIGCTLCHEKP